MLPNTIYYIKLVTEEGDAEEMEFTSLETANEAYKLYKEDSYFTKVQMVSYDFESRVEKVIY